MKRDVRDDPIYKHTREFFSRIYAGSFGNVSEFWDISASNDGHWIALAGTSYDDLDGLPRSRIALFDAIRSTLSMLQSERNDTSPRWAPNRECFGFLSDRADPDRYAAYVCEPKEQRVQLLAAVDGSVESIAWSPDGARAFLQSVATQTPQAHLPDWTPQVEQSVPDDAWRRIWICDAAAGSAKLIDWLDMTVWEAAWCGDDGLVAVVSDNPREASWFQARLVYIDLNRESYETIYNPSYQIGLPAATCDGRFVAIVEGCCSDRGIVAGDVLCFDRMVAWRKTAVDTAGVDVTFLCSRDAARFSFAGVRDLDVACGDIAAAYGTAKVNVVTSGSWARLNPVIAPIAHHDYAAVAQRYTSEPALVRYDPSAPNVRTLCSFSYEGSAYALAHAGDFARRSWTSHDGLEIHGYLAQPASAGPHPLVVFLHGGPVWAYQNSWCLYMRIVPVLVHNGYAVLLPNPRGSSGRGQSFVRLVCGDLGGGECTDVLSGIQSLVDDGVADETRLAVFGGSHGGYLTASLIAQTDIFGAAICAFPVIDIFSGYLTGTPSEAMPPFINGRPFDVDSQFFRAAPLCEARISLHPCS